MGAHTTSDDPTRYRLSEELEHWKLKDPIERVKAYLARHADTGDDFFDEVAHEADEFAAKLRADCLALPDPSPLWGFDKVYADVTPELIEQRDGFAAYLDSFADSQPEVSRS